MATKLTNNATGKLAVSVAPTDTQISLMPGDSSSIPVLGAGDSFPLTLVKANGELEIMLVTGVSGSVLTVTRGQEGTSPKAFNAGDRAEVRLTAGTIDKIVNDTVSNNGLVAGALQKNQNLNDLQNKGTARNNLGLGTASTRNSQVNLGDYTEGRTALVGYAGWGKGCPSLTDFDDVLMPSGNYRYLPSSSNKPEQITQQYGSVLILGNVDEGSLSNHVTRLVVGLNSNRIWLQRSVNLQPWTTPVELLHTGNMPDSVPAGTVLETASAVVPSGYLKANGAAVSRTTYAALFAAIGTRYGEGDGSSTFNLPDARGLFKRGWDDGRGIDASRVLGSTQDAQNLAHTHTASTNSTGAHTHSGTAASAGSHSHSGTASSAGAHAHGIQNGSPSGGLDGVKTYKTKNLHFILPTQSAGAHTHSLSINSGGAHTHTITANSAGGHSHTVTVNSSGGSDLRPQNIALMTIIKY